MNQNIDPIVFAADVAYVDEGLEYSERTVYVGPHLGRAVGAINKSMPSVLAPYDPDAEPWDQPRWHSFKVVAWQGTEKIDSVRGELTEDGPFFTDRRGPGLEGQDTNGGGW